MQVWEVNKISTHIRWFLVSQTNRVGKRQRETTIEKLRENEREG